MNNSLNKGYQVAQGFRDIKNLNTNWISSSYALYYYIQNLFLMDQPSQDNWLNTMFIK